MATDIAAYRSGFDIRPPGLLVVRDVADSYRFAFVGWRPHSAFAAANFRMTLNASGAVDGVSESSVNAGRHDFDSAFRDLL
jgi:hypothetical protein